MNVFYLHGFASSPLSAKAAYFAERLRAHDITLRAPDFNEPDFATLTMTRMLAQLDKEIVAAGDAPVVLIGSSLGAVVALETAARLGPRIDRLVLLAPALRFPADAPTVLGAERVVRWRETGTLDVFHHSAGRMRAVNYTLYEDALQYDAMTTHVTQPMLIFQGRRDAAVDYRVVAEYAAGKPHVTLVLLDDDHQLIASLPRIWAEMALFLGVT